MKKIITTISTLIILFSKVTAQDLQVVTLDKAGEMFSFYGGDAFVQAMEKADHGDIVTLSTGTFNSCDITKAVKIYGQGHNNPGTKIAGKFNIAIDSTDNKPNSGLYVEGIETVSGDGIYASEVYVSKYLMDAEFRNCKISDFTFSGTQSTDVTIRECIIRWFYPGNCNNMCILNSGVDYIWGSNNANSTLYLLNCVVLASIDKLYSTWRNCIIGECWKTNESGSFVTRVENGYKEYHQPGYFPKMSSFHYCVYGYNSMHISSSSVLSTSMLAQSDFVEHSTRLNESIDNHVNNLFVDNKVGEGNYVLTDEAQTIYLGSDSTQVGVYGGNGFHSAPTIPKVIYKNIATKTIDNKLKANIIIDIKSNE